MKNLKKALFLDRDGTIIVEPPEDQQVDSLEKLEFIPGVIRNLYKLSQSGDFELVLVSNQDGRGTASFPEISFIKPQMKMMTILKNEGVDFDRILIDPSLPEENSPNRKPGIGMMGEYLTGDYDLQNSFVIGDRSTDMEFAANLGCRSIFFGKPDIILQADLATDCWDDISRFILAQSRVINTSRITGETEIHLTLNPDGDGVTSIETGIGFFDHMLEQLARHSGCDLTLKVKGDLQIDTHHTIEDTGLALGTAFSQALGKRKGISRYGFYLPMDECSCRSAVDFSGRPCLVWNVSFTREKIGDMPTEMFKHFFKSFTDTCGCTLHISADGENEHHKIEGIFKSVARSIKMAIRREQNGTIPSTKGVL